MKLIASMFLLLSIFSFNSFAEDFSLKFCSDDQADSVTIARAFNQFDLKYKIILDGEENSESFSFNLDNEFPLDRKDLIDILSDESEREIQSAQIFELSRTDENGKLENQRVVFAKDNTGDVVYFEANESPTYIGTVNNCK